MKDNKYRITSFRDEIFVDEKNIEEVIYRLNTKYEMMKELYEDSEEEIERLNKENEQLRTALNSKENIINKAIGLIYDYQMNDENNENYKELLEILDKE